MALSYVNRKANETRWSTMSTWAQAQPLLSQVWRETDSQYESIHVDREQCHAREQAQEERLTSHKKRGLE